MDKIQKLQDFLRSKNVPFTHQDLTDIINYLEVMKNEQKNNLGSNEAPKPKTDEKTNTGTKKRDSKKG